ncbi:hypothetical protein MASR1M48_16340 [Lactococcus petauri]
METILIGGILIALIVFGSIKDYRFDKKTNVLIQHIKAEKETVYREHHKTDTFSKL